MGTESLHLPRNTGYTYVALKSLVGHKFSTFLGKRFRFFIGMAGNAGGADSSKYKSQAAVLLWNPNEKSGCISNMVDNTSDTTAALQESQKLASFGGILKEDGLLDIGVDWL